MPDIRPRDEGRATSGRLGAWEISAAREPKFDTGKRANTPRPRPAPPPSGRSPTAAIAITHSEVKLSRKDIRRPTRSLIAPSTGETAAFSPTLMAGATP